MKKINLVHVTTSLALGGAETVLCEIVQHLDAKKFDQTVVYFYDGPHLERLKALDIPAIRVKGLFFQYDPVFWIRLIKLLRKLKPDCLHSLLWSANFCVRLIGHFFKIPVVNALHNHSQLNGTLRQLLDKITGSMADKYIAVSSQVACSMDWIPAQKIEVIGNGIDTKTLLIKGMQYKKTRYELELSDEQFIIGSVGRLVPSKRFDLLIESFALINQQFPLTRLMIVGSGPEEVALKKLATRLGVEQDVLFMQGQACGYYPLFDCFIMTSLIEGVSIALLEACSFGIAAIVTQENHPIITPDYNGIIVSDIPAQVAGAVANLIENPMLRRSLGGNAYKTVLELCKVDVMAQHYSAIFSQLVVEK